MEGQRAGSDVSAVHIAADDWAPSSAASGPVSHAIFRLARVHRATISRLMRGVGLHPPQEQVMMRLWEAGPQRQVDLLGVLDCDAATMTRMVARLERAGFVRRSPSPSDRRVTIVEPTAAGLALRGQVERIWRQLEELTAGEFDEQERDGALGVLQRLEANLSRSGEQSS